MAARPMFLVVVVLALITCSAGVTQGEPLLGAKASRVAAARAQYCSPSGDLCYGAFGSGTTVRLRLTLFAGYFTRYSVCVRGPDGKKDCRRFRLHRIENGMYDSSVSWVRHFPFRGPGRYRATWDWGTGPVSPSIAFEAGPSIRVKPVSVRSGSKVLVYGLAGGCPKGDVVTLLSRAFPHTHEFAGVPAVFAEVLAGDRYNHTVGIPAKRRAGTYSITARCGGGNFGVQARLRVR